MIPFLLLLMFAPASCDTTPCDGASHLQVLQFNIYWCVAADQRSIIFTVRASMYNHFSVNYKQSMINANYTIVQIENGRILVRTYWSRAAERPTLIQYDGLNVIGTNTDGATFIAVKYSLPLSQSNALSPNFFAGNVLNFSLAWRETPFLSYHGLNLEYFSGKLQNQTGYAFMTSTPVGVPILALVHGLVLTVFWCLLADIATFLITFRHKVWAYALHIYLMIFVVIGNLVMVIFTLRKKRGLSRFHELQSQQKSHLAFAVMILAWFAIQLFSGALVRILQVYTLVNPKWIKWLSWIHLISGYLMLLAAKVNILLGWWMSRLRVPFWLLLGWNILVVCLFVLRKWSQTVTKYQGYRNVPSYVQNCKMDASAINLINSRPYNHPDLASLNYVIFADYVYDTSKFRFLHPGGRYIMDSLKGRQIDRFIYGMYPPETLHTLAPYEHSQDSLTSVQPAEFKLSRPLQNGSLVKRQGGYYMSKCDMYSKDHYIVYFNPCIPQTFYACPPPGYEYLGQYYTLTAFGKTRLYTRVQCLMPENKRIQLKVLKQLRYKVNFEGGSFSSSNASTVNGSSAFPTQRTLVDQSSYAVAFLIKKYKSGAFTRKLLSSFEGQFEVQISPPLGRGLDIDKIPPGRIVIFAGGTGIFPYMDLIDVLFKTVVIEDGLYSPTQIYQVTPALQQQNLLQLFTFHFYVALERTTDIHPVHFSMMRVIAQSRPNMVSFTMKVKQKGKEKGKRTPTPGMIYTKERFDTRFVSQLGLELPDLSMIYVCGPPLMNAQLLESFKQLGVSSQRIFIL